VSDSFSSSSSSSSFNVTKEGSSPALSPLKPSCFSGSALVTLCAFQFYIGSILASPLRHLEDHLRPCAVIRLPGLITSEFITSCLKEGGLLEEGSSSSPHSSTSYSKMQQSSVLKESALRSSRASCCWAFLEDLIYCSREGGLFEFCKEAID